MRNKKGISSKDIVLFDMRTTRPDDTKIVAYHKFGATFGKKKFYKFIDEVKKLMGIILDLQTFSYMIIEDTLIDGESYYELSLNENVFLPIAGSQLSILKRYANDNEMSLNGFIDSINSILNDSRVYN